MRTIPFRDGWLCLAARGFRDGHPRAGLVWYLREGRAPRRLSLLPRYNFWDLQAGDVDGDGKPEIALCTWSRTRLIRHYARRFFIYGWDGRDVYPKWRGSRLGKPYVQARLVRFHSGESPALLSVEITRLGRRCLVAYRWNDFGFTGLGESPPLDSITILESDSTPPLVRGRTHGQAALYAVERLQERLRLRRICSLGADSVVVPGRFRRPAALQVFVFPAGRSRSGHLFDATEPQRIRRR